MGVHSPEEVSQFGCTDLKVLSDTLADKPFFFGDEPTTVSVNNFIKHAFVCRNKETSHVVTPRYSSGIFCILCK